jgi:hypothetical protein
MILPMKRQRTNDGVKKGRQKLLRMRCSLLQHPVHYTKKNAVKAERNTPLFAEWFLRFRKCRRIQKTEI